VPEPVAAEALDAVEPTREVATAPAEPEPIALEPAPPEPAADETDRPAPIETPVIRAEIDRVNDPAPRAAEAQAGGDRITDEEYEERVDQLLDREDASPFRRIIDRARGGESPRAEPVDRGAPRGGSGSPSRKDLEEPSFLRRLRD
jgi:hypothetical protein